MCDHEQTEVRQQAIGIAGFACLICFLAVYLAARPLVLWLSVWWAGVPIYSVVPIGVAFVILYRSAWHEELPRVTRILSMILSSCIIFAADLLMIGIVAVVLMSGMLSGLARLH
jgi:hypothetical protein